MDAQACPNFVPCISGLCCSGLGPLPLRSILPRGSSHGLEAPGGLRCGEGEGRLTQRRKEKLGGRGCEPCQPPPLAASEARGKKLSNLARIGLHNDFDGNLPGAPPPEPGTFQGPSSAFSYAVVWGYHIPPSPHPPTPATAIFVFKAPDNIQGHFG